MILAIDPGNTQSAYAWIDNDFKPKSFGIMENYDMRLYLQSIDRENVVIERIKSYGNQVGDTIFDTCIWIGRFLEVLEREENRVTLVERRKVKLNLCGKNNCNDANIIAALKERFGDKGTKANPGFFYGFSKDVWQAYALAVTWLDLNPRVDVRIEEV